MYPVIDSSNWATSHLGRMSSQRRRADQGRPHSISFGARSLCQPLKLRPFLARKRVDKLMVGGVSGGPRYWTSYANGIASAVDFNGGRTASHDGANQDCFERDRLRDVAIARPDGSRSRLIRGAALAAIAATSLMSCESAYAPPQVPTLSNGKPVLCAGGSYAERVELHGSPNDLALTWLMFSSDGHRLNVVWPPGYRARFAPTLAVLDPSGNIVAVEGQRVEGGCPMPNGELISP